MQINQFRRENERLAATLAMLTLREQEQQLLVVEYQRRSKRASLLGAVEEASICG